MDEIKTIDIESLRGRNECTRDWLIRRDLIQNHLSDITTSRLISLSHCLVNVLVYGCVYQQDIMEELRQLCGPVIHSKILPTEEDETNKLEDLTDGQRSNIRASVADSENKYEFKFLQPDTCEHLNQFNDDIDHDSSVGYGVELSDTCKIIKPQDGARQEIPVNVKLPMTKNNNLPNNNNKSQGNSPVFTGKSSEPATSSSTMVYKLKIFLDMINSKSLKIGGYGTEYLVNTCCRIINQGKQCQIRLEYKSKKQKDGGYLCQLLADDVVVSSVLFESGKLCRSQVYDRFLENLRKPNICVLWSDADRQQYLSCEEPADYNYTTEPSLEAAQLYSSSCSSNTEYESKCKKDDPKLFSSVVKASAVDGCHVETTCKANNTRYHQQVMSKDSFSSRSTISVLRKVDKQVQNIHENASYSQEKFNKKSSLESSLFQQGISCSASQDSNIGLCADNFLVDQSMNAARAASNTTTNVSDSSGSSSMNLPAASQQKVSELVKALKMMKLSVSTDRTLQSSGVGTSNSNNFSKFENENQTNQQVSFEPKINVSQDAETSKGGDSSTGNYKDDSVTGSSNGHIASTGARHGAGSSSSLGNGFLQDKNLPLSFPSERIKTKFISLANGFIHERMNDFESKNKSIVNRIVKDQPGLNFSKAGYTNTDGSFEYSLYIDKFEIARGYATKKLAAENSAHKNLVKLFKEVIPLNVACNLTSQSSHVDEPAITKEMCNSPDSSESQKFPLPERILKKLKLLAKCYFNKRFSDRTLKNKEIISLIVNENPGLNFSTTNVLGSNGVYECRLYIEKLQVVHMSSCNPAAAADLACAKLVHAFENLFWDPYTDEPFGMRGEAFNVESVVACDLSSQNVGCAAAQRNQMTTSDKNLQSVLNVSKRGNSEEFSKNFSKIKSSNVVVAAKEKIFLSTPSSVVAENVKPTLVVGTSNDATVDPVHSDILVSSVDDHYINTDNLPLSFPSESIRTKFMSLANRYVQARLNDKGNAKIKTKILRTTQKQPGLNFSKTITLNKDGMYACTLYIEYFELTRGQGNTKSAADNSAHKELENLFQQLTTSNSTCESPNNGQCTNGAQTIYSQRYPLPLKITRKLNNLAKCYFAKRHSGCLLKSEEVMSVISEENPDLSFSKEMKRLRNGLYDCRLYVEKFQVAQGSGKMARDALDLAYIELIDLFEEFFLETFEADHQSQDANRQSSVANPETAYDLHATNNDTLLSSNLGARRKDTEINTNDLSETGVPKSNVKEFTEANKAESNTSNVASMISEQPFSMFSGDVMDKIRLLAKHCYEARLVSFVLDTTTLIENVTKQLPILRFRRDTTRGSDGLYTCRLYIQHGGGIEIGRAEHVKRYVAVNNAHDLLFENLMRLVLSNETSQPIKNSVASVDSEARNISPNVDLYWKGMGPCITLSSTRSKSESKPVTISTEAEMITAVTNEANLSTPDVSLLKDCRVEVRHSDDENSEFSDLFLLPISTQTNLNHLAEIYVRKSACRCEATSKKILKEARSFVKVGWFRSTRAMEGGGYETVIKVQGVLVGRGFGEFSYESVDNAHDDFVVKLLSFHEKYNEGRSKNKAKEVTPDLAKISDVSGIRISRNYLSNKSIARVESEIKNISSSEDLSSKEMGPCIITSSPRNKPELKPVTINSVPEMTKFVTGSVNSLTSTGDDSLLKARSFNDRHSDETNSSCSSEDETSCDNASDNVWEKLRSFARDFLVSKQMLSRTSYSTVIEELMKVCNVSVMTRVICTTNNLYECVLCVEGNEMIRYCKDNKENAINTAYQLFVMSLKSWVEDEEQGALNGSGDSKSIVDSCAEVVGKTRMQSSSEGAKGLTKAVNSANKPQTVGGMIVSSGFGGKAATRKTISHNSSAASKAGNTWRIPSLSHSNQTVNKNASNFNDLIQLSKADQERFYRLTEVIIKEIQCKTKPNKRLYNVAQSLNVQLIRATKQLADKKFESTISESRSCYNVSGYADTLKDARSAVHDLLISQLIKLHNSFNSGHGKDEANEILNTSGNSNYRASDVTCKSYSINASSTSIKDSPSKAEAQTDKVWLVVPESVSQHKTNIRQSTGNDISSTVFAGDFTHKDLNGLHKLPETLKAEVCRMADIFIKERSARLTALSETLVNYAAISVNIKLTKHSAKLKDERYESVIILGDGDAAVYGYGLSMNSARKAAHDTFVTQCLELRKLSMRAAAESIVVSATKKTEEPVTSAGSSRLLIDDSVVKTVTDAASNETNKVCMSQDEIFKNSFDKVSDEAREKLKIFIADHAQDNIERPNYFRIIRNLKKMCVTTEVTALPDSQFECVLCVENIEMVHCCKSSKNNSVNTAYKMFLTSIKAYYDSINHVPCDKAYNSGSLVNKASENFSSDIDKVDASNIDKAFNSFVVSMEQSSVLTSKTTEQCNERKVKDLQRVSEVDKISPASSGMKLENIAAVPCAIDAAIKTEDSGDLFLLPISTQANLNRLADIYLTERSCRGEIKCKKILKEARSFVKVGWYRSTRAMEGGGYETVIKVQGVVVGRGWGEYSYQSLDNAHDEFIVKLLRFHEKHNENKSNNQAYEVTPALEKLCDVSDIKISSSKVSPAVGISKVNDVKISGSEMLASGITPTSRSANSLNDLVHLRRLDQEKFYNIAEIVIKGNIKSRTDPNKLLTRAARSCNVELIRRTELIEKNRFESSFTEEKSGYKIYGYGHTRDHARNAALDMFLLQLIKLHSFFKMEAPKDEYFEDSSFEMEAPKDETNVASSSANNSTISPNDEEFKSVTSKEFSNNRNNASVKHTSSKAEAQIVKESLVVTESNDEQNTNNKGSADKDLTSSESANDENTKNSNALLRLPAALKQRVYRMAEILVMEQASHPKLPTISLVKRAAKSAVIKLRKRSTKLKDGSYDSTIIVADTAEVCGHGESRDVAAKAAHDMLVSQLLELCRVCCADSNKSLMFGALWTKGSCDDDYLDKKCKSDSTDTSKENESRKKYTPGEPTPQYILCDESEGKLLYLNPIVEENDDENDDDDDSKGSKCSDTESESKSEDSTKSSNCMKERVKSFISMYHVIVGTEEEQYLARNMISYADLCLNKAASCFEMDLTLNYLSMEDGKIRSTVMLDGNIEAASCLCADYKDRTVLLELSNKLLDNNVEIIKNFGCSGFSLVSGEEMDVDISALSPEEICAYYNDDDDNDDDDDLRTNKVRPTTKKNFTITPPSLEEILKCFVIYRLEDDTDACVILEKSVKFSRMKSRFEVTQLMDEIYEYAYWLEDEMLESLVCERGSDVNSRLAQTVLNKLHKHCPTIIVKQNIKCPRYLMYDCNRIIGIGNVEQALVTPMDDEQVGYLMLSRLGWDGESGLGTVGRVGNIDPVVLSLHGREGRTSLGFNVGFSHKLSERSFPDVLGAMIQDSLYSPLDEDLIFGPLDSFSLEHRTILVQTLREYGLEQRAWRYRYSVEGGGGGEGVGDAANVGECVRVEGVRSPCQLALHIRENGGNNHLYQLIEAEQ